MAHGLIGRDTERASVIAALDRVGVASAAVLVRGPAGICKTAVLEFAIEAARARGLHVIAARPTRAESQLAFAVLADLVRGADLSQLGGPARHAVEVALGSRSTTGPPPQTHELGAALIDLLSAQVAAGRQIVAIVDDIQWADAASREVLTFAARRLPDTGVCLLIGQRTAVADVADDDVDVELPEAQPLELAALPARDIATLLDRVLGHPLPAHVVEQISAAAGGYPFYAVELARGLDPASLRVGRPLTLPPSLRAVATDRIGRLPGETRRALAAAAMLAHADVATIDALGVLDALAPAERARVVTITGRRVAFTHPLLAAAAHDALTGSERIALRRQLADATTGTARCIHLALSATAPDPIVAAELTAAATAELARGASAEAAHLAVLALDTTAPDDPCYWDRRLRAAELLFRAGNTDAAAAELEPIVTDPPSATVRSRALVLLATIEYSRTADDDVASTLARAALASTTDPLLQAEAHTVLARVLYADFEVAAKHADEALTLLRRSTRAERLAVAAAIQASASARFLAGHGLDRVAFDEAIELERGSNVSVADSAYGGLAALLKYADELDESRAMLESLAERADAASLPYALSHLPQLHLWAGRWDAAEDCARRHLWLAEHTFQDSQVFQARFNLAIIAGNRGDLAAVEQIGTQLFGGGRASGDAWNQRNGAALLGLVAVSTGDAAGAARFLGRVDLLGEQMNLREPGYARTTGDYVEALLAIGDRSRAIEVVERLTERATRLGRRSAIATALRSSALLAAAAGDREGALAAARRAVQAVDATPLVYERARAELTLGVVARRAKERGVARRALSTALAEFERMGAASLAARARHELTRVGARAAGVAGLTPGEVSVAELAAAGSTTREIADSLFISTKTVEANLTRIYRKLGVANRAQLSHAIAARQAVDES